MEKERNKMRVNKKGKMSIVVAWILIILSVIVAVGVIWKVIITSMQPHYSIYTEECDYPEYCTFFNGETYDCVNISQEEVCSLKEVDRIELGECPNQGNNMSCWVVEDVNKDWLNEFAKCNEYYDKQFDRKGVWAFDGKGDLVEVCKDNKGCLEDLLMHEVIECTMWKVNNYTIIRE